MVRHLKRYVLLVLVGMLIVAATAQAQAQTAVIARQNQRLKAIKLELDLLSTLSQQTLSHYLPQVIEADKTANRCLKEGQVNLDTLSERLKTLGPAVTGEPADISSKRATLAQNKTQLEQQLASCRLLLVNSQELTERITTLQKSSEAEFLLTRGPSVVDIIRANLVDPSRFWSAPQVDMREATGMNAIAPVQTLTCGALLLIGLSAGFGVRWRLMQYARRPISAASLITGLSRALLACTGHYMPFLLPSALLAAYLTWQLSMTLAFFTQWSYGVTALLALLTVLRTLLAPCPPAAPFLPLPTALADSLHRRLRFLTLLAFVGFTGHSLFAVIELPIYLSLVARDLFVLLLVGNLLWIVMLLGQLPFLRGTWRVQLGLGLGLLMGLGTAWTGYTNLSTVIIWGIVTTVAVLSLAWLIAKSFADLYDALDEGHQRWASQLRARLGIMPGETMPGLVWLRVLTALMMWSGCVLLILMVWGLVPPDSTVILGYFTQPFTIGTFQFVPVRLPLALLSFLVVTWLVSWLKKRLAQQWLRRTRLDRGAREAVVTITGYLGMIIAGLLPLSIMGIRFGNLAIVAGALSLGIGFGLQNIVNNFVSGIILLFERPIKTGDWIRVGDTQGYVRKISIRSTRIQTIDRADVIVPNSQLLAEQVTNWTLLDNIGRVQVAVGVAYGSDTARVKQILLDVAETHPLVIKKHPFVPLPRVLFLAFGESALNFELWCFISDINQKVYVLSDLNFAIDNAFRNAGIEIPFPQRDIHMRHLPAVISSATGPQVAQVCTPS